MSPLFHKQHKKSCLFLKKFIPLFLFSFFFSSFCKEKKSLICKPGFNSRNNVLSYKLTSGVNVVECFERSAFINSFESRRNSFYFQCSFTFLLLSGSIPNKTESLSPVTLLGLVSCLAGPDTGENNVPGPSAAQRISPPM